MYGDRLAAKPGINSAPHSDTWHMSRYTLDKTPRYDIADNGKPVERSWNAEEDFRLSPFPD